jgi:hypothetical protein
MRITYTYTYTCSLCGFSGEAQEVSPGHLIAKKRSLAQFDTCKLADETPDFRCPRLQEAIDRAAASTLDIGGHAYKTKAA